MHKKFKINQTQIKGGCQLGRKVVTHNSKSDSPLTSEVLKALRILPPSPFLFLFLSLAHVLKVTRRDGGLELMYTEAERGC